MTEYGCVNYVGDEDCRKCMIHGILLNGCPYGCKDYEDRNGNNEDVMESEWRKNSCSYLI